MNYDVRFLEKKDGESLANLVYVCHGYTYPWAVLYTPDAWWQSHQKGEICSAGAFDSNGCLVAHMAAVRPYTNSRIYEYDCIFIHPDHRRQQIGFHLGAFLSKWLDKQKAIADYSTLTCAHPYAQKLNLTSSQKECALAMAFAPQNMVYRDIGGKCLKLPHRDPNLLVIHPRIEIPPKKIYLPPKHQEFLLKLYKHIGFSVEIINSSEPNSQNATVETAIEWTSGFGAVEEVAGGKDSTEKIATQARKLVDGYLECIIVLLRVDTPTVTASVNALEEIGFFLIGLFPCFRDGDALLMQHVSCKTNLEYIHLETPMGKDILQYILNQGRISLVK